MQVIAQILMESVRLPFYPLFFIISRFRVSLEDLLELMFFLLLVVI